MSNLSYHGWTHKRKSRGGTDPIPPDAMAVYEIKVFEDINVVIVGDGAFYWPIPEELDKGEIIKIEAGVSTPSSSGSVQVQVAFSEGDAAGPWSDVLSSKVVILADEYNDDETAAINGDFWVIHDGDWLRCDVDAAGSGAMGLALMVTVAGTTLGSVVIEGAQGPPGGVTDWTGGWQTGTDYTEGQSVSHNGTSYVAIQDHTSGSLNEPGVGVNWEDYWQVVAAGHLVTEVIYVMDASPYVLSVGVKGPGLPIYFDATIVEATLLADVIGSIVVDIWRDTYGSYPPTDADSITGATPLTLSSALKTTDTTLTGWTTAISAGDVLRFNVDSASLVKSLSVGLKLERT